MSEYSIIKGWTIPTLSSDPPSPIDGQIWYNSTSNDIKCSPNVLGVGAWTSGGTMNEGRRGFMSAGTQTAAVYAGGNTVTTDESETYNGSTWTATTDLNNAHPQTSGGGTQTAAWCQSGPAVTEFFDGSTWSDQPTSDNTNKAQRAGCGPQTSALLCGSEPMTTNAETYDGSTWTAITAYPRSQRGPEAVGGVNTAVIVFGGDNPSDSGRTVVANSWDGSSWTSSPSLNTARFEFASMGTSSTAAMALGGTINPSGRTANVEEYDGSSWTETSDLATTSAQGAGTGSTTSGLFAFGYYGPSGSTLPGASEEWTSPTYTKTTVTVS